MARIKIQLPEQFAFVTELPLYIEHVNHGNHLDNARLLSIISEARVRFFKSMGYTELNVEGVGIVIADVAVQYRSEAIYGETMVVGMSANYFHDHGCDLVWQVRDKDTDREVARGKTGIVFFDYGTRTKALVPAGFVVRSRQD
jgi:4-hydroxybenzoyl-CoA thioesterase